MADPTSFTSCTRFAVSGSCDLFTIACGGWINDTFKVKQLSAILEWPSGELYVPSFSNTIKVSAALLKCLLVINSRRQNPHENCAQATHKATLNISQKANHVVECVDGL